MIKAQIRINNKISTGSYQKNILTQLYHMGANITVWLGSQSYNLIDKKSFQYFIKYQEGGNEK
jgi:hypothetical protein